VQFGDIAVQALDRELLALVDHWKVLLFSAGMVRLLKRAMLTANTPGWRSVTR
jgi:hypothetical protein